ncbi:hypothetical protein G5I_14290 [Acromyrmex echinatior]|uniref:Uncharacterized protein n=1 Tax=Acromyrmex echinatior TaxID=103372 RepID=F4X700_ACREC|nr:hypothetical protein G5I_14290 [Acromyrmex echinatior]
MAPLRGLWETFEVRMGTDGGENGLFHGYRAMKPVNRMMNVRDVNLTGDSGRLQRTADAANTDPYITFIAAQALVIPCTVRSLRIGRVGVSWVIALSQPPVVRGASKRRWCESWLRLGERTLSRYDVALICSKQVSAAAGPWVGCGVASGGTEEDDTAPEDGPADGIANLHAS